MAEIKISNLSDIRHTIAALCDSKSNGGNEDKVINKGREKGLYEAAVESISNRTFIFKGQTYNADGSVFDYIEEMKEPEKDEEQTVPNFFSSVSSQSTFKPSGKYHLNVSTAAGFSNQYDSTIIEFANKYGIEPNMVKAIMKTESSFNPNAVSSANCQGLMQVNPKFNSGNLFDVRTNINAGCRIFRECLDAYNGDKTKALMAYNQGITGAKRSLNKGVSETNYSRKVLANYNELNSNQKFGIVA